MKLNGSFVAKMTVVMTFVHRPSGESLAFLVVAMRVQDSKPIGVTTMGRKKQRLRKAEHQNSDTSDETTTSGKLKIIVSWCCY